MKKYLKLIPTIFEIFCELNYVEIKRKVDEGGEGVAWNGGSKFIKLKIIIKILFRYTGNLHNSPQTVK